MSNKDQESLEEAMFMAINAAEQFLGATAPNPPVGAIALDKNGKVLCGAGHQKAGAAHAEVRVLELAKSMGKLEQIHTLVVTLEPCNHQGKTPPCVETILKHKNIRRVAFGAFDPNPEVRGGGAAALKAAGIEVIEGVLQDECEYLIRAFAKTAITKTPWITLKAALKDDGSMIPPTGEKTFTSEESLRFAHELRKRADAIWTGSGTILADNPEFTVRHIPDHPGKKRFLVISDRRGRVSEEYKKAAQKRGFTLLFPNSIASGLEELANNGVLEVLVEAGPTLRQAFLDSGLWDEDVVIQQGNGEEDIQVRFQE